MKDNEIIERIESGDERALDVLYQKYYKMMVKLVTRNSGTEQEAQDIFQEALIVFWQKVTSKQFTLTSKISTYLYSICQNLWRKELDRKKRHSNEEKDVPQYRDDDQKERVAIVNQCIKDLGETCQQVLLLYYFDGLSMTDIAKQLGFANADTAKTKKYKCKKELDKLMKSRYSASDFLD